ncbi:MAG: hypothetical protein ACLTEE_11355 [Anaerobutyricum hallii]
MRASGEEAFLIPWEDMLYSKVFEDGGDWWKKVPIYKDSESVFRFLGRNEKIDDLISNQKGIDQCLADREKYRYE